MTNTGRTGTMGNFGNRITRGQFIRRAGMAGVGAAAVGMGLSGVASAVQVVDLGGGACEVYPTNDPNQDIVNVQNAVDSYSDVLLKSVNQAGVLTRFNFGSYNNGPYNSTNPEYSTIKLSTNVTVRGEGMQATNVVGGLNSFTVLNGSPTIKNIWFDSNYLGPIWVHTCNGANIIGNKITNPIPVDVWVEEYGFNFFTANGINVTEGRGYSTVLDGTITGTVTVDNNYLDLFGPSPTSPFEFLQGWGIGLWGIENPVTFIVSNNTIKNSGDSGISMLSFQYGTAKVTGNHIYQRAGTYNSYYFVADGIQIGSALNFNTPPGSCVVEGNDLHNISEFGIWCGYSAANNTIKNNQIDLLFTEYGAANLLPIGFFLSGVPEYADGSNNNLIQNNTIRGVGSCTSINLPFSHDNKFYNNDSSALNAYFVQTYLMEGSYNNGFTGNKYGGGTLTGLYCAGYANNFTNENFLGNYPGWSSGLGCVLLDFPSNGNTVTALKNGIALQGFSVCDQILDLGGSNSVPGYEKCQAKDPAFIQSMQAKAAELTQKVRGLRHSEKVI